MAKKIKELGKNGFSSIAVIGITLAECQKIKKHLEKRKITGVPVLTGHEEEYRARVMIVTSYATKGLEFDAVLIVTIDEHYRENELDAKLLNVAMTRVIQTFGFFAACQCHLDAESQSTAQGSQRCWGIQR